MSTTEFLPPADERTTLDWQTLLLARLDLQARDTLMYESYYAGEHPLVFATSKFREAFGNLFGAFADNWCEIVVDAPVERLEVVGFRFGEGADEEAWEIWQQNALDVESVIAHTEAGKLGQSFLLVDPNGEEGPRITVEHPAQVYVATDPGDRRRRLAALKRWLGDDGHLYATLYLPELVVKWQSETPQAGGTDVTWVERTDDDFEVTNPLGVVPVIPCVNRPRLMHGGISDLQPAIPLQNAVNKLCSDMIVASEYGAFRQRVLTGVEIPRDPETGKPIGKTQVEAAMSRLWQFEEPDAKVTDLAQTDLSNFVTAIEMVIQHLAAQTRTPPHYLLASMVNASGDALKTAEAGLVSKVRGKIKTFSDAWEEAMSLALQASGRDVDAAQCEVLWGDPERTSISTLTDAAIKKRTLEVPLDVIWLELGYTPEQIEDMKELRAAELADAEAKAARDMEREAELLAAKAATVVEPEEPPKEEEE